MRYRKLGNSELLISEIGFGSWLTFTDPQRKRLAVSCVHRALDLGINFLDTANVYGQQVNDDAAASGPHVDPSLFTEAEQGVPCDLWQGRNLRPAPALSRPRQKPRLSSWIWFPEVIGKGYDSRRGATIAMHAAVKSERNGLRHKPAQTRGKSFMLRYG